jgi:hypothetical protein
MNRFLWKSFSENPKSAIQNPKWLGAFGNRSRAGGGGCVGSGAAPRKVRRNSRPNFYGDAKSTARLPVP